MMLLLPLAKPNNLCGPLVFVLVGGWFGESRNQLRKSFCSLPTVDGRIHFAPRDEAMVFEGEPFQGFQTVGPVIACRA